MPAPSPYKCRRRHSIEGGRTLPAQQFHLVTDWKIDAPIEQIWALLRDAGGWPGWWPMVAKVEPLAAGDADGVGAVNRLTWRTALPYTLAFDMRVTRVEPMSLLEGRASGELDGTGRWTLRQEGDAVLVRYDWRVDVTKAWMRWLAPVLRPVFAWNHGVVMEKGRTGMLHRLGLA